MNSRTDSGPALLHRQGAITRIFIGFSALLLVLIEISGIWKTYHVIELYAPPGATALHAVADRLAVVHVLRILVIATLLTGWRWSLWATVATYLIVYLPNPWVAANLVNANFWPLFLLPLLIVALAADRQLLIPWWEKASASPARTEEKSEDT